jgi:hypothetical protein
MAFLVSISTLAVKISMIAANTSFHINQPYVGAQKAHTSPAPFVPNYPPQRQEKSRFKYLAPRDPLNLLKLTDVCHPECSEGSQSCQCYVNASFYYMPGAFRFFASLRFAQNDNLGQTIT